MENIKKPVLKLTGQDGNAFMIIGLAKRAAQKAKWPADKVSAMVQEMMSGDYDNLLRVALDNFDVE